MSVWAIKIRLASWEFSIWAITTVREEKKLVRVSANYMILHQQGFGGGYNKHTLNFALAHTHIIYISVSIFSPSSASDLLIFSYTCILKVANCAIVLFIYYMQFYILWFSSQFQHLSHIAFDDLQIAKVLYFIPRLLVLSIK